MTALAHQPALRGRANGGVAARRAVIRWAGRMFRREWRQQILVVTLLTVAVAAAIGSITIVRNTGPGDDAEFGTANTLLNFDASDRQELDAGLAAAQRSFGTIDAIAHRSVAVPGGVETVDFRAQDPDGPYGGVLLALREGSYPKSPTEVAVTDGVAELLQVDIGSSLTLEGQRWTVVGIAENPRELSEEFALVSPSSALAARRRLIPSSDAAPTPNRPLRGSRGEETTSRTRRRWPCSRWPPSHCCWRRSLPPPASRSSRSAGCGSSGCSLPSAPPRSSCDSFCWPTAPLSERSPPSSG